MTTAEIVNGNRCSLSNAAESWRPYNQVKKTSSWYSKFIIVTATQGNWNPVDQPTADQLWHSGRIIQNDPCAHYKTDGTYQEFWHEGTDMQDNGDAACTDAGTAWRMPVQEEWGGIFRGGTIAGSVSTATANTWVENDTNGHGYEIRPDGATTTLFLPANGYRYLSLNADLAYQGSQMLYWSSAFSTSINAYFLNGNGSTISPAASYYRAAGLGVRCVSNN
jgi:hypothetical protein